jgi:hypothetical protein
VPGRSLQGEGWSSCSKGQREVEDENEDEDECSAGYGRAGQGKRAQNQPLLATAYRRARRTTFDREEE